MHKLKQIKEKSSLILIVCISVLFACFIFISCGKGPTGKSSNPYGGSFAQDNTDCPRTGFCIVSWTSLAFEEARRNITGKEITMEAWVKPKASSSATIFSRSDDNNGAYLHVAAASTSTPTEVTPQFTVKHGTGTTPTTVTSTVRIVMNAWHHIAGILVNDDHSDAAGDGVTHATCSGGEAETPHLDIYVDGTFAGCASTGSAYASNPVSNGMVVSSFQGVVDEFRLWTTSRLTNGLLQACRTTELDYSSGNCGRLTDSLIAYLRFNEGEGETVNDFTGLGSGGREYALGGGLFGHWETGWTTDIPDDATDITPAN